MTLSKVGIHKKEEIKCDLHGVEFVWGTSTIRYGRVPINPKYTKDSDHFINSNTFKLQGRKPSRVAIKEMKTYYCPKCRELEEEWVSKNGSIFSNEK